MFGSFKTNYFCSKGILMRKKLINESETNMSKPESDYLDIEQLAQVEISSECSDYPIEFALLAGSNVGWKAADAGNQVIRLIFDEPQTIKHIELLFDEPEVARTQEIVLLWRMDKASIFREILRQQFHFSPPLTTRQSENYAVDLNQLKVLELRIIPDMSGVQSFAQLTKLRLYTVNKN